MVIFGKIIDGMLSPNQTHNAYLFNLYTITPISVYYADRQWVRSMYHYTFHHPTRHHSPSVFFSAGLLTRLQAGERLHDPRLRPPNAGTVRRSYSGVSARLAL